MNINKWPQIIVLGKMKFALRLFLLSISVTSVKSPHLISQLHLSPCEKGRQRPFISQLNWKEICMRLHQKHMAGKKCYVMSSVNNGVYNDLYNEGQTSGHVTIQRHLPPDPVTTF